jgi:hypothetical protein
MAEKAAEKFLYGLTVNKHLPASFNKPDPGDSVFPSPCSGKWCRLIRCAHCLSSLLKKFFFLITQTMKTDYTDYFKNL